MYSRKTRSQNSKNQNVVHSTKDNAIYGKREAETRSPEANQQKKKRAALSDVTNKSSSSFIKSDLKGKSVKGSRTKSEEIPCTKIDDNQISSLPSVEEDKENDSVMIVEQVDSESDLSLSQLTTQSSSSHDEEVAELCTKLNWVDIDSEQLSDPFHVALYANDIFSYFKQRELKFLITDYMSRQSDVTATMRAVLVDWLVEVQENFELNHETLYIAVKLVDQHLHRFKVTKETLQLVGTTAMFIACKFEERCPPVLDDFLYICDDAYNRDELIAMEQKILIGRDFDLGIPLSYSFLRRYSKCARTSIETLTLARFILETSLMDVKYITYRDSLMAAACLYLALKMKGEGAWDDTMLYYTGYDVTALIPLMKSLNDMLKSPPYRQLSTIRSKYSHQIFHEVAKIPPLEHL